MSKTFNLFAPVVSDLNTVVQQNKNTVSIASLVSIAAIAAFQATINMGKQDVITKVGKLDPDFILTETRRPLSFYEQAAVCAAEATIIETLSLHSITPDEKIRDIIVEQWINEGAFLTASRSTAGSMMTEAERAAARGRSEEEILAELASAEGGCAGGACTI